MTLPPFHARAPWWGGDLQTARNYILRDYPDLSAWPARQLDLSMANGDRLSGALHWPGSARKRPLVMLIHGFTGCADSAYMLATAHRLLYFGYPVLRLNLRGAGPTRPDCREIYHAGRSDDLREILASMPLGLLEFGLTAVGFSLGGNMLLKYLGEAGADTPFSAAVAVSVPVDLAMASQRMRAPRNRFYQRWLLNNSKREWLKGPSTLDSRQVEAVGAARSLYELDDAVVGPLNGFTGADDYYDRCGAKRFLTPIEVPTLLIHAADDPWVPAAMYRQIDWATNDNLMPAITPGGGHVGFHGRGGKWHNRAIVQFLDQVE